MYVSSFLLFDLLAVGDPHIAATSDGLCGQGEGTPHRARPDRMDRAWTAWMSPECAVTTEANGRGDTIAAVHSTP